MPTTRTDVKLFEAQTLTVGGGNVTGGVIRLNLGVMPVVFITSSGAVNVFDIEHRTVDDEAASNPGAWATILAAPIAAAVTRQEQLLALAETPYHQFRLVPGALCNCVVTLRGTLLETTGS